MKPIFDRILVEMVDEKIYTSGNFQIINLGEKIPKVGKVLVAGHKCEEVNDGDIVLYGQYAGTNLLIKGHNCILMRESDVLAIL